MRYLNIITLPILLSCNQQTDNVVNEFKQVDSSLQKTTTTLQDANTALQKLSDSSTVALVKPQAESLTSFIEGIKNRIKEKTEMNQNEDAPTAVEEIMIKQRNAEILFSKIESFEELCATHIKSEKAEAELNDLFGGYRQNKKIQGWFFKNVPSVAAMTMLNKFENDVKNAERIVYEENIKK